MTFGKLSWDGTSPFVALGVETVDRRLGPRVQFFSLPHRSSLSLAYVLCVLSRALLSLMGSTDLQARRQSVGHVVHERDS